MIFICLVLHVKDKKGKCVPVPSLRLDLVIVIKQIACSLKESKMWKAMTCETNYKKCLEELIQTEIKASYFLTHFLSIVSNKSFKSRGFHR